MLNEKEFGEILDREHHRATRSHRSFVLMLVESPVLAPNKANAVLRRGLLQRLAKSIRGTDSLGWHSTGSAAGIVFAEVGETAPSAAASLHKKFRALVDGYLPAEMASRTTISVDVLPSGAA